MKQVTKADWKLWARVVDILRMANDHVHFRRSCLSKEEFTLNFECHSICWALAILIPELKRIDGKFFGIQPTKKEGDSEESLVGVACDHSWLVTPDNALIDPYPVGFVSPNPIVIGNGPRYWHFGRAFYIEDSDVTRRKVSSREVHRKCSMIVRFAQEAEARKSDVSAAAA